MKISIQNQTLWIGIPWRLPKLRIRRKTHNGNIPKVYPPKNQTPLHLEPVEMRKIRWENFPR
jgi:hypothetical protein